MNFFRYSQLDSALRYPIRLAFSMLFFLCALFLSVSLITYSPNDLSWFVLSTNHDAVRNFFGQAGAHCAGLVIYLLGVHAVLLVGLLLLLSFSLFVHRLWYTCDRLIGGVALFFSGPLFCNVMKYDPFSVVVPGGLCGHYGVIFCNQFFTQISLLLLSSAVWVLGFILLFRVPVITMMSTAARLLYSLCSRKSIQVHIQNSVSIPVDALFDTISEYDIDEKEEDYSDPVIDQELVQPAHFETMDEDYIGTQESTMMEEEHRYSLPSKTIFAKKITQFDHNSIPDGLQELALILEHKLERFGVKGKVSSIKRGPVVTLFEYEPNIDSKISKIIALEDDLALALQALSIRIIAPIPGRSVVGFEVSNKERSDVLFSDIIHSKAYKKQEHSLPIILGVDTIGDEVVVDLARMPHLLVAGSTGSGKSVGLNTMLVSLLCSLRPDELKLILVDPKRLEFAPYADIPHLLFPIVTNPKYASPVLRWVVNEMERRYSLMAACGVRNSTDYQKQASGDPDAETMPFIVVVIDELADLMMTAGKEIEGLIARIAQMARAAGIHMIVATQRPSVDVITGLIKANFPSRIAFRVSSRVDSRTIIDTMGANKLLGRGDMLFINSSGSLLQRIHGAYVSDAEIEKLTNHLKAQGEPCYLDIVTACPQSGSNGHSADDELYADIKQYLQDIEELSISSIQRKFRIGYNRSARIIEMLESEGLILPAQGGKMRKVVR